MPEWYDPRFPDYFNACITLVSETTVRFQLRKRMTGVWTTPKYLTIGRDEIGYGLDEMIPDMIDEYRAQRGQLY